MEYHTLTIQEQIRSKYDKTINDVINLISQNDDKTSEELEKVIQETKKDPNGTAIKDLFLEEKLKSTKFETSQMNFSKFLQSAESNSFGKNQSKSYKNRLTIGPGSKMKLLSPQQLKSPQKKYSCQLQPSDLKKLNEEIDNYKSPRMNFKKLNKKAFFDEPQDAQEYATPLNRTTKHKLKNLFDKNLQLLYKTKEQYFANSDKPLIKPLHKNCTNQFKQYYQEENKGATAMEEKDNYDELSDDNDETNQKDQHSKIAKQLDMLLEKHQQSAFDQKALDRKFLLKNLFEDQNPFEKVPQEEIEKQEMQIEEQKLETQLKTANQILQQKLQKGRNIIRQNKKNLLSKKEVIRKIQKVNRAIFYQNLPKLMKQTNLKRIQIHQVYILYKILQEITSQKYKNYNINEGLDFDTFRNGIYNIFIQSEFVAKKIFQTIDVNDSKFLSWEEFLQLMSSTRATSIQEKIDLFIRIADADGNGLLSHQEIKDLSKECLSKFMEDKGDEDDDSLNDLCDYYGKLIFECCNEQEEEITFDKIKEAIIENNEEKNLLLMFCGADI